MRIVLALAVVLGISGCGGEKPLDPTKQRLPEGSRYVAWPADTCEMMWSDVRGNPDLGVIGETRVRCGDEVIVIEDAEAKMWPRMVRARAMTGECAGRTGVIPVSWLRPIPR